MSQVGGKWTELGDKLLRHILSCVWIAASGGKKRPSRWWLLTLFWHLVWTLFQQLIIKSSLRLFCLIHMGFVNLGFSAYEEFIFLFFFFFRPRKRLEVSFNLHVQSLVASSWPIDVIMYLKYTNLVQEFGKMPPNVQMWVSPPFCMKFKAQLDEHMATMGWTKSLGTDMCGI